MQKIKEAEQINMKDRKGNRPKLGIVGVIREFLDHQNTQKIVLEHYSDSITYVLRDEPCNEHASYNNETERLFFAKKSLFDAVKEAIESPALRSENRVYGIYTKYGYNNKPDQCNSNRIPAHEPIRERVFVDLVVDLNSKVPIIDASYVIRPR